MRTRNVLVVALALALVATAAPASAVELHGYWRSGIGGNSAGGGQTCFGLGQFGYKFRLGNECETYGELEFRQNLYKDRSGVTFDFVGMLAVQTTQNSTFDTLKSYNLNHNTNAASTDPYFLSAGFADIALRQTWIGAKVPQLGGVTLWAGNR